MTWTDEAIDYQLSAISSMRRDDKPFNAVTLQLEAALLELKRVRAWARFGLDSYAIGYATTLRNILNGDPAPSEEVKP